MNLRDVSDVELVYRFQALARRGLEWCAVMAELRRRFPEALDEGHAVRLAMDGVARPCGSIDRAFLREMGWV